MESVPLRARTRVFSLPELIFISLMAGLNVVFDFFLSPVLIVLLGHVIAGILIMVPINFIFISLTKHLVDKFGSLTLYMFIFGALSIPTTFYGGFPGVYKLLAGLLVGLLLDFAFVIKKPIILKVLLGGFLGAIGWWFASFFIWTLLDYPFITGMSTLLNELVDLSNLITVPITEINQDFFFFVFICGLFSAIQCIVVSAITYPFAKSIKKTPIYEKFTIIQ